MEKIIEFLIYLQGPVPYIAAFGVLLLCGLGIPIPEDLTLFAMGLLSFYGLVDLKLSIIICLAGVMIGDSFVYFLGKKFGLRLTQKGIFKKILTPQRLEKTKEHFHKWGNKVIFAARFMPGLRSAFFFSAGTLELPFRVFFFYDGLAALLSVPALIYVTYHFGEHVDSAIQFARRVQHGIVLSILALVIFLVLKKYLTSKLKKAP